ncbi:acyltransferase [Mesobacillus subterraneus]|uniref:acyltransferase family protein n=1 Tax=Mesobacillus subterraneus TaxID=285983 RepID=UPI00203CDCA8|nr:acyltransferase [Mesobacillus subterraneus]MCM3665246.1 acyltransferase [Mesobacillus subterraneus]MCM3684259.1 acyltransferase [Mesobacillus subterraneus]
MNNRLVELDSLRGIAALTVFCSHIYLVFNETLLMKILFEYGPLRVFTAGSEAVTLFFVLSGFVLSFPFITNKPFNYFGYFIKRLCRIYLPYLAAFLLAIISWRLFYTKEIVGLSNWFNVNWSQSINFNTILVHIVLVKTFMSNLNNVIWSLVHEMRISLFFPIIMYILMRMNFVKGLLFAFLLSVLSMIYFWQTSPNFTGTESYVSIHYSAIFIVGALLARYKDNISHKISSFKITSKLVLFFTGICLYLYAHPSFILSIIYNDFPPFYRTVIDSWFTSFGAGILIMLAISSSLFSKILKNNLIIFLGNISYSLYLTHLIVLFASIHLLYGVLPMWVILLLVIVITLIVSSFMYYWVEKPAIKLGKLLININIDYQNAWRTKARNSEV